MSFFDRIKITPARFRFFVNLAPCIRSGGGKVISVSDDFMKLTVKLTLNWRTQNIMGTIYGGSMYSSTDPFYMLLLMQILGKDYVVWDKGCTIRFKKPAKGVIFADFVITPEALEDLKKQVEEKGEATVTWPLAYKSKDGVTFAEFDKVIYVATKSFYHAKLLKKSASQ